MPHSLLLFNTMETVANKPVAAFRSERDDLFPYGLSQGFVDVPNLRIVRAEFDHTPAVDLWYPVTCLRSFMPYHFYWLCALTAAY